MKRVDQIIKYLSGDLGPGESRELEEAVRKDPETREEFDAVSAAYSLIGDQLRLRDERAFAETLRRVMKEPESRTDPGSGKKGRGRWILLAVAASFALIVGIMHFRNMDRQHYEAFYHPGEDAFLQALQDGTRGMQDTLVRAFQNKQYESLREDSEEVLKKDPGNRMALLFNLLASMETNREADALTRQWDPPRPYHRTIDESITWYRALACLKTGDSKEAVVLLKGLDRQAGPYQEDAQKLLRLLTK